MKKNIIHISTSDFNGAGTAAYKFHKSLQDAGMSSTMLVMNKTRDDSSVLKVDTNKYMNWIKKQWERVENVLGFFDKDYYFFDRGRYAVTHLKQIDKYITEKPDAIVLSWISRRFVDLIAIKQLQDKYKCKVFWYPMDMGPLTGGCHYAWDCVGYQNSCENCPAVRFNKSMPSRRLIYKYELIKNMDIDIVCGTHWLENQVSKSRIFKDKVIHKLLLGIDSNIFKPVSHDEMAKIKERFGIRSDKKIVFFGATSADEKRKGFYYLKDALNKIEQEKDITDTILLMTAGNLDDKSIFDDITIEHIHIGYLNGEEELSLAYKISHLFVNASIEDSGPMMINQAIISGTPVVSFNMGVAPDLVINGETGYVAELKNSKDLAFGIKKIVSVKDDEYSKIKMKCRELGMKLTSSKKQIESFIEILGND